MADKPPLDRALAAGYFPVVRGYVRRGVHPETGDAVWVAAGWLRGNPRIGIVIFRPIEEGSQMARSQLMFCLQELESMTWGEDNNLNFPRI